MNKALEEAIETFKNGHQTLEAKLMQALDTPTWLKVFPLLDRIKELTNEIEGEVEGLKGTVRDS